MTIILLVLGVLAIFAGAVLWGQAEAAARMRSIPIVLIGVVMTTAGAYGYKATPTDAPIPAAVPQVQTQSPAEPVIRPTERRTNTPAPLRVNRVALFQPHPDAAKTCVAGTYIASAVKPTNLADGAVEVEMRRPERTDMCSLLMPLDTLRANPIWSGMTVTVGVGTGNNDALAFAPRRDLTNLPLERHHDSRQVCAEGNYGVAELGLSARFADKGYLTLRGRTSTNACTVYVPLTDYVGLRAEAGMRVQVAYDGTAMLYSSVPEIMPDHVTFMTSLRADTFCPAGMYTLIGGGLSARLTDTGYLNLGRTDMAGSCTVYLSADELTQMGVITGLQFPVSYGTTAYDHLPRCGSGNGFTVRLAVTDQRLVVLADPQQNLCKVENIPANRMGDLRPGNTISVTGG